MRIKNKGAFTARVIFSYTNPKQTIIETKTLTQGQQYRNFLLNYYLLII